MTSAPRQLLPVQEARSEIVKMIRKNRAVIIVGETGSGKTTQIPQYVWDSIFLQEERRHRSEAAAALSTSHSSARKGAETVNSDDEDEEDGFLVGCTQPRRVAAVSIARHVARQRGGKVGGEVGYAVRFDDTCTRHTRIKFLTDGILLREIQADPLLRKYGCLLLDEAHERTLHGDVLFGLLKDICRRRKRPLKIVVMSATLNAEQFSKFWWNAPIGVVHGREFPVTIMHTIEPQNDYVEATISTVLQIHLNEAPGDVLCFLTGQEEIEDCKHILEARLKGLPNDVPDFYVLTLYSAMPYEQQMLVFEPAPNKLRKVILATNIAETSITVEGIKYVVDCGAVKSKFYNSKSGMEALDTVDISRAQAKQRSGRAGRMEAGKCFRLYSAAAFEAMEENTVPEIKRSSLISVVLQMKNLHIDSILDFEFMDVPHPQSVIKAEETLMVLRALNRQGTITPMGVRLTDFPIEPTSAMALLEGKALGVAHDVVAVVAMTNTENIFLSSREHKEGADRCKASFFKSSGDHATLLSIYQAYKRTQREQRQSWCEANSISFRQMLKVQDVVTQLMAILHEKDDQALFAKIMPSKMIANGTGTSMIMGGGGGGGVVSYSLGAKRGRDDDYDDDDGNTTTLHHRKVRQSQDYELVRRALCFGFFLKCAFFNAKTGYYQTVVGNTPVHVHPSSVLFEARRKPPLVLFNSVVQTTKRFIKDVSVIHEEWLLDAAPDYFRPAS